MKPISQIKYESRVTKLVRAFQKTYQHSNNHNLNSQTNLTALESALNFYSQLSPIEKSNIRSYTLQNGEITFTKLVQITSRFNPDSISQKVGLINLKQKLKQELQKIPESEAQKYLLMLNNQE